MIAVGKLWKTSRGPWRPRLLWHFHELFLPTDPSGGWLTLTDRAISFACKHVDRVDEVIFPDAHRAAHFKEEVGMKDHPRIVMNCPPLIDQIPPEKLTERLEETGFSSSRIVLFQGWIGPTRCFEAVINSISYWPKDAILVLVGSVAEDYKSSLLEQAQRLGVDARMLFLGTVPYQDLFPISAGATIGLSLIDGGGAGLNWKFTAGAMNKRFEYIALGVPQVSNNGPGVDAIVKDTGCGLLVDESNPEEIGKAINRLLTDDKFRNECSRNARRAHRDRFCYEIQFRELSERILSWCNRVPVIGPSTSGTIPSSDRDRRAIVPVSVVIPTYNREKRLLETIRILMKCDPLPSEILIFFDGQAEGDDALFANNSIPIRTFFSEKRQGPGGARNILVEKAAYEIVCGFDDDSYPLDSDYFDRVIKVFNALPEAAAVMGAIHTPDHSLQPPDLVASECMEFSGSGTCFRRSSIVPLDGYVPLPIAYGMEESDLSIQLWTSGRKIYRTQWFRVRHDSLPDHSQHARFARATIKNIALISYLRYPATLAPLAFYRWLRVIGYGLKYLSPEEMWTTIKEVPSYLRDHRHYIRRYSTIEILSFLSRRFSHPEFPLPETLEEKPHAEESELCP